MYWLLYVSITFLLALPSSSLPLTDPCVTGNHVAIDKGKYRGTQCPYRFGKAVSDRYIDESMWYKADGPNGPLSIPTSHVDNLRCSTKSPIWMNGSHPTSGITVSRTACMSGPASTCEREYQIEVKNCSGFYVYKLQKPLGSERAYCFGQDEPCPPTDPCVDIDRDELPDDGHRAASCSPTDLCDNNTRGWYRVYKTDDEEAALQMAGECPNPGRCGATSPIWLEENHPTSEEGIVTRSACVRNETDCCGERFDIKVVKCQSYYVYELTARTNCPERYCFGSVNNEKSCHPGNDNILDGNKGVSLHNSVPIVILTFLAVMLTSGG